MEVRALLVSVFFSFVFFFPFFFFVLIQPQAGRETGGKLEEGGEMRSRKSEEEVIY